MADKEIKIDFKTPEKPWKGPTPTGDLSKIKEAMSIPPAGSEKWLEDATKDIPETPAHINKIRLGVTTLPNVSELNTFPEGYERLFESEAAKSKPLDPDSPAAKIRIY